PPGLHGTHDASSLSANDHSVLRFPSCDTNQPNVKTNIRFAYSVVWPHPDSDEAAIDGDHIAGYRP
ncbi:hypothetical protein ABZV67_32800, partial [Streptomyces sp. NPDC005065]|uniref:hypothetical protein n=1 Tax=Streptomyces sp. NPDC005065 TaxID=3154461 RepID=UPI0033ABB641